MISHNKVAGTYTLSLSPMPTTFRVVTPRARRHGIDAQWSDDFHHALHSLQTGERDGYYTDFGGLDRSVRPCRMFCSTGNTLNIANAGMEVRLPRFAVLSCGLFAEPRSGAIACSANDPVRY